VGQYRVVHRARVMARPGRKQHPRRQDALASQGEGNMGAMPTHFIFLHAKTRWRAEHTLAALGEAVICRVIVYAPGHRRAGRR
jgi:hypothetical protein